VIAIILAFAIGIGVGIIASIVAVIAILRSPPRPRQTPIYSAIGAGRARTTGEEDLFEAIDRRLT
jgi:hypothetical protein